MWDLRDLYQEVVLEHGRHPRKRGSLPDANHHSEGFNPLCGDRCTVHVRVDDGRIAAVRTEGSGCAISVASASLMAEAVEGHTVEEARALFDAFHRAVTDPTSEPDVEALGKLAALTGVRAFPMRVKCATLAWHTLMAALEGRDEPVTTE